MRRTGWYGANLAVIGSGLLFWSSGSAQPGTAGNGLSLTVARARELAMTQNAGIRASAQSVVSATAQRNEARAARLPGVLFSARYARLSDVPDPVITTPSMTIPTGPGTSITTPSTQVSLGPSLLDSYNLTATAQVPLFTGFRLENREKAAEYAARAAGEEYAASQLEVGNRVEQVYWRLYSARAAERVISESVKLAEAHLEDVRRLHAAGMATADDILAVEVRLSEARLRQIQAENASELVRATLCNLLSVPVSTEIALVDSPSVVVPSVPDQDALVSAALANRPELRALAFRKQAMERGTAAVEGGKLPSVMFQTNYEVSNPNQRYFPTRDAWHATWSAGMGVTWTAWDWGIVGQQAARARAEERQVDERLNQLRDAITLQVVQARLAAIESNRRVAVAEEGVRSAEAYHRSMRARYSAGTATNTEVLDAQILLERARLDLVQARTDQRTAAANLAYVVGDERTQD